MSTPSDSEDNVKKGKTGLVGKIMTLKGGTIGIVTAWYDGGKRRSKIKPKSKAYDRFVNDLLKAKVVWQGRAVTFADEPDTWLRGAEATFRGCQPYRGIVVSEVPIKPPGRKSRSRKK